MGLSNRSRGRSERPTTVKFAHVSHAERRQPSWLTREEKERRYPSFHPPISRPPLDGGHANPREHERARMTIDHPAPPVRITQTPNGQGSSLPPNPRGINPAELEALVAERALQNATAQLLDEARTVLAEAIESFDQARRDLAYVSEPRLVELAMLVARRVIGRELLTQPELVADLVREGIDALASSDTTRVRVGAAFGEIRDLVLDQLATRGIEVELVVSPHLADYACVVETELGRVDESVEERLNTLLESIEEERET